MRFRGTRETRACDQKKPQWVVCQPQAAEFLL